MVETQKKMGRFVLPTTPHRPPGDRSTYVNQLLRAYAPKPPTGEPGIATLARVAATMQDPSDGTLKDYDDIIAAATSHWSAGTNGTAALPAFHGTDTDSGVAFGSNTIYLATQGLYKWMADTVSLKSYSSLGPYLLQSGSSDTVPTLCPRSNDTNTGIGGASADELSLITGGVEAMRIDSTGNVGIGTSSPGAELDVDGDVIIRTGVLHGVSSSGAYKLSLGQGSDVYLHQGANNRAVALSGSQCRIVGGPLVFSDSVNVNSSATSAGVALYKDAANILAQRNDGYAQEHRIYSDLGDPAGNYERGSFAMDTSGDLTISTEKGGTGADGNIVLSPASGNITIPEDSTIGTVNAATRANIHITAWTGMLKYGTGSAMQWDANVVFNNNGLDQNFSVHSQAANYALFVEGSSGNVGIGTSSPTVELDVVGDANVSGELVMSGNAVGTGIKTNWIGSTTQGRIMFGSYNGTRGVGAGSDQFQMTQAAYLFWTGTDNINNAADTSLFREAAGYVGVGTGSTTADGTLIAGNVGIGTTSPAQALSVEDGTIRVSYSGNSIASMLKHSELAFENYRGKLRGSGGLDFYLDGTGPTSGHAFDFRPNVAGTSHLAASSGEQAYVNVDAEAGQSGSANYVGLLVDATETSTGSGQDYLMDLRLAGTSRFNVTPAGNVGIGTTAPGAILNIVNTSEQRMEVQSANNTLHFWKDTTPSKGVAIGLNMPGIGALGDDMVFSTYSGSAWSERVRVLNSNGNVGIGVAAPAYKLDISGNIRVGDGTNPGDVQIYGTSGSTPSISCGITDLGAGKDWQMQNSAGDFRLLMGGGSNPITVDNDTGRVGINDTTPGQQLEVNGICQMSGGSAIYFRNSGGQIASPGTNELAISTNGVETMRFDNNNRVGIGTASPSAKLSVSGTTNDGSSLVQFTQTGTGRALSVGRNVSAATRPMAWFAQTHATGGSTPALHVQQADADEIAIGVDTAGTHSLPTFSVKGNGDVYAAGKVGIGTTSPGTVHGASYGLTKLHIDGETDRGQIVIEGDTLASIILSDNGYTENERVFTSIVNDGVYSVKSLNDSGSSGPALLSMEHSGNVGIGTASPAAGLHVKGDRNNIRIQQSIAGSYDNGLEFASYDGGVVGSIKMNQSSGEFRSTAAASYFHTFYSGSSESMRIDTSGNVGIGTASPSEALEVVGSIVARETDDGADAVKLLAGASSGAVEIYSGGGLKTRFPAGNVSYVNTGSYFAVNATSSTSNDPLVIAGGTGAATGNSHGFVHETAYTKSAAATGSNSFDAFPTLLGYVAHDHFAGFQSRPQVNIGSNTMTRLCGVQDMPAIGANSVVTTRRGVEVREPTGTGTVATNVGLYVEALTGTTDAWAVYTAGTTKSHFGGTLEMDRGTEDAPFVNYKATADADTTSAISTLTTSGATTHHIQVDINGTKAWIAVSTNNPS